MAKKPLPTPEQLRQLLRYEPETGRLFWREQTTPEYFRDGGKSLRHSMNAWNAKYAGREAFTASTKSGHRRGRIAGHGLLAHRVIWAMHIGTWDFGLIDHRDLDGANNRMDNMRPATKSENGANRVAKPGASSQYLGVGWHKAAGKWKAAISTNDRTCHLGLYDSEEDAARAYDVAAGQLHGEFARLNFAGLSGRAPEAQCHPVGGT